MNELYTIVYYTSNREDEAFEDLMKKKLLEVSGDIPIISVSQKPITLGHNICVGDVGACDHNLFRQILTAAKEVKTPYIISCEADCIYPPEYFTFVPDDDSNYYRFNPIYVFNKWGKGEYKGFFPKTTAPFAQITKTKYYVDELERAFTGLPMWRENRNPIHVDIFSHHDWSERHLENSVISFKTGNGMRKHSEASGRPVDELSYWGDADSFRKEIWPLG